MTTYVTAPICLSTEYGELEPVPLECQVSQCWGHLSPLGVKIHNKRLSPDDCREMVGDAEWNRQMRLLDQWWQDNRDEIEWGQRAWAYCAATA